MPARSRAHAEAFTVSAARNYREFPAPPIDAESIRVIGGATSRRYIVRVDYTGEDEPATLVLEPHDLVVWAARWYLVAFEPDAGRWRALRIDRLEPHMPTGRIFDRRDVPHGDPAAFVMSTHDRGDTPAEWPCRGSALAALPAPVVARFAPADRRSSTTPTPAAASRSARGHGAGLAGLLLTFYTHEFTAHAWDLAHATGIREVRPARGPKRTGPVRAGRRGIRRRRRLHPAGRLPGPPKSDCTRRKESITGSPRSSPCES